jgi:protein SCO1/2
MTVAGSRLRGAQARALLAAALLALASGLAGSAEAQYFRRPVSDVDPRIMTIDEKAVLGEKLDPATPLIDSVGREFRWGDLLGKPVILVLSYYTCDGSCSIINGTLAGLLRDVKAVVPGDDFRIATLSFDRHDTLATTQAFRKHLDIAAQFASHWTFATFKNEADLKAQTERIGFKFFWSPEDRIFLHPGAFLFFSPDGRLIRVLYQEELSGRDVELAVLDAKQGQFRPSEIINFALSLCYSYSYHDGKYVMSIPVIVGLGALGIGLATLFGSMLAYKITSGMKRVRNHSHAEAV